MNVKLFTYIVKSTKVGEAPAFGEEPGLREE